MPKVTEPLNPALGSNAVVWFQSMVLSKQGYNNLKMAQDKVVKTDPKSGQC